MITSPDMLNDLFVTKNKYYDKKQVLSELLQPFLGDSLVFTKGDEKWLNHRKSLG